MKRKPSKPKVGKPSSYLAVHWQAAASDGAHIYIDEIDAERWCIRCVRKYVDGRSVAFDYGTKNWKALMPETAMPTAVDINRDPQFSALEISAVEFETHWQAATKSK